MSVPDSNSDVAEAARGPWWEDRWIPIGPHRVNSLWHCFGVDGHEVGLDAAVEMLRLSRTTLLPINTHAIAKARASAASLRIGHGSLTYAALRDSDVVADLLPCLNINLQTSAEDAVALARAARDLTSISLLKLEVLGPAWRTSKDAAVITGSRTLGAGGCAFLPRISAGPGAEEELVALGVPLLRVMGSPIGSCAGIAEPARIREIVALGTPVILDGGLGSAEDFLEA